MNKTSARLLVMLFVLTLFAAGCAKKPVMEEETSSTEMTEQTMTEQQPAEATEQMTESAEKGMEQMTVTAAEVAEGLTRIHFDFDQYVLTDTAKMILEKNAALIKSAPEVKVQIQGNCDERGSDEYNLALGEKRALAAQNYLVSLGVNPDQLCIISYGEEMPLDPAHTEAAWAKNRRDDFKVQ